MDLPDIYVSTDIEADGFAPGLNSMLSFGSAAFLEDKTLLDTFSANLETLPEATMHPQTEKWWKTQPQAWQACRENAQPPHIAMHAYYHWLEQLPGKIIFVAYPLAFDFRFIDYYFHRFVGKNPFGFSAIDIRSYVMGMHNIPFRKAGIHHFPKDWFDELQHTHIALDDAIEQGTVFCNILQVQRRRLSFNKPEPKL